MRSVDFILCAGPSLRALSKGRRDGVALWAARSGCEARGGPEPGGSQSSRGGEAAGADLQLPAELAASWSWSKDGRPSSEWPGVPHRAGVSSRAFPHVRGLSGSEPERFSRLTDGAGAAGLTKAVGVTIGGTFQVCRWGDRGPER